MTTQEILDEIDRVKEGLARATPGSIVAGELTVALVLLYNEYIRVTESKREAA